MEIVKEIGVLAIILIVLFYPTYYLAKKKDLSMSWSVIGTLAFGPFWWISMLITKKGKMTVLAAFAAPLGTIIFLGIFVSLIIPKLAEVQKEAILDLPKCSDVETIQLVKQILNDNQLLSVLYTNNKMEDINLDLIRTVKKDKESEMYTCKANIDFGEENEVKNPMLAAFSNITYTVAMTDDKKQFVVEILSE